MDHFFNSLKFKILIGILIFLMGMMVYAGANGRLTAAPQEIFSLMLTPLQSISTQLTGGVGQVIDKYKNFDETMEEVVRLRKENAQLKNQMVDYDKILAENEAYKKLAGLQQDNPEKTYVQAFVIGRDSLDSFGGFTIDKGTLSGIEQGDTVISEEGCLIGTVVEANLTSCKVLTILHPSFNAAGMVSRTRDNAIVAGSSSYADDGLCTLTNLARDTLSSVGDEVVTTGLGGVYPPDIRVGALIEIQPEVSGKSSVGIIQPATEIKTVKQVFVVTSY